MEITAIWLKSHPVGHMTYFSPHVIIEIQSLKHAHGLIVCANTPQIIFNPKWSNPYFFLTQVRKVLQGPFLYGSTLCAMDGHMVHTKTQKAWKDEVDITPQLIPYVTIYVARDHPFSNPIQFSKRVFFIALYSSVRRLFAYTSSLIGPYLPSGPNAKKKSSKGASLSMSAAQPRRTYS